MTTALLLALTENRIYHIYMEESSSTPLPSPPAPPSFDDPKIEIDLAADQSPHDHPHQGLPDAMGRPHHPLGAEWLSLIMGFCFAAISIDLQAIQASSSTTTRLPISFHFIGLGLVLSLAALFVSKYIPAPQARVLENFGVLFGVTAFFMAITFSFPLYLKVMSWAVYIISLITIILYSQHGAFIWSKLFDFENICKKFLD